MSSIEAKNKKINILAHRLGLARAALKAISESTQYPYEEDWEYAVGLKLKAEEGLRAIKTVTGKVPPLKTIKLSDI